MKNDTFIVNIDSTSYPYVRVTAFAGKNKFSYSVLDINKEPNGVSGTAIFNEGTQSWLVSDGVQSYPFVGKNASTVLKAYSDFVAEKALLDVETTN